jgi:hypothetical protein
MAGIELGGGWGGAVYLQRRGVKLRCNLRRRQDVVALSESLPRRLTQVSARTHLYACARAPIHSHTLHLLPPPSPPPPPPPPHAYVSARTPLRTRAHTHTLSHTPSLTTTTTTTITTARLCVRTHTFTHARARKHTPEHSISHHHHRRALVYRTPTFLHLSLFHSLFLSPSFSTHSPTLLCLSLFLCLSLCLFPPPSLPPSLCLSVAPSLTALRLTHAAPPFPTHPPTQIQRGASSVDGRCLGYTYREVGCGIWKAAAADTGGYVVSIEDIYSIYRRYTQHLYDMYTVSIGNIYSIYRGCIQYL